MKILNAALLSILLIFPGIAFTADNFNIEDHIDIEDHKGKVIYVDFWASWCTSCLESFPFMQEMTKKYADDLVIIAVNVDKSKKDADAFLESFATDFKIVFDPEGKLAQEFDVQGMPTSYLFDTSGALLGSHSGFKIKDIPAIESGIAMAIENDKQP